MSEYELISLLREHVSFMITILQWWAGLTLGILIAVQVMGNKLNGYIASFLIALHTAFTLMVMQVENRHSERIEVMITDLRNLHDQGMPMSETSMLFLNEGGPSAWVILLGLICFWGFYLSTIAYVIYCYRIAKQAE